MRSRGVEPDSEIALRSHPCMIALLPSPPLSALVGQPTDIGVAPPPWRTARRNAPPPDEGEGNQEGSEQSSDTGGGAGGGGSGDSGGSAGGGGDGGGGRTRRRKRRRRRRRLVVGGISSPATPDATALLLASPSLSEGGGGGGGGRQDWRGLGGGRARSIGLEEKDEQEDISGDDVNGAGGEEEEEEVALPPGFIPDVAFDDAPSVRFVFSARLEPAPPLPNQSNKRSEGARGKGDGRIGYDGDGSRERRLVERPGWRRRRLLLRRRRRRRQSAPAAAAVAAADAGRRNGAIVAEMETEWTPLTRIREEHAPMPAPDTKCMQVRGCGLFVVQAVAVDAKYACGRRQTQQAGVCGVGVCLRRLVAWRILWRPQSSQSI